MDKAKAQKIAKLLEFERDFKANPSVAILSENEKVISAVNEVKNEVETIKDDSQKIVEAINNIDQSIETRIENKVASIPPIIGPRGFKGEPGKSPLTVSKTPPPNPQKGDLWYQD